MDTIVSMTGRLGTDVDVRTSRSGTRYARFRLASTNRILRDGVWVDGETNWVSVRCYRQLGENSLYSLRRGQPVVVVGRLRVETWVDEAGVPRETTVLDALTVGHDLNWGITSLRRMERERASRDEPIPTAEDVAAPEPPDGPVEDSVTEVRAEEERVQMERVGDGRVSVGRRGEELEDEGNVDEDDDVAMEAELTRKGKAA